MDSGIPFQFSRLRVVHLTDLGGEQVSESRNKKAVDEAAGMYEEQAASCDRSGAALSRAALEERHLAWQAWP